ncbi:DUF6986 family protein [Allostreptomyces psammosilenae]|uniref:Aldolase n=1 Tax=Allostreptomyces psammosilenae TaxID=1892865 RepID=A0A852ZY30_9ACTN|nr:aldolase/citrate lyase family protein [Allostreptomyces psammosilenae]NYI06697.1 hypothetical protein [Allostreptomyces psammosilenae]
MAGQTARTAAGAEPAATGALTPELLAAIDRDLAPVDAELAGRYPGDPAGRRPVHTVYVPADRLAPGTARAWGERALEALDRHAPDAAALADVLGTPAALADEVHRRVRAKLEREPVEDLRIDFEDGYGVRSDAEEDAHLDAAVAALADDRRAGTATPWAGIRTKCLEAPVRARALRTLDRFVAALVDAGLLGAPPGGDPEHPGAAPGGLLLTLPKVTYPQQVTAFVTALAAIERAHHLPAGALRFEVQVETPQAILGADGRATVARLLTAGAGRITGLHYGTYDYSASLGVAAAHQSLDHPAADHAKAVMQLAAAGTGVRVSDGSSNVVPVGDTEAVHAAWRLHHRLVRRSLARAYYQGWDMHPAQLPTRYAAVYTFYREGLPAAVDRLAAYRRGAGGGVLDEPATARALAGFLLRGVDCGALDEDEVTGPTGLARTDLDRMAGRSVT